MENKQLSYDALKSVLRHMEANKRLKISAACPSLRKVEKKVPLKINHLLFHSNYEIRINDKFYQFGVIRNYQDGATPRHVQFKNDGGGIHIDFDEYGIGRESYGIVRTPGDIVIGDVQETLEENDEADMRSLLNELKKHREDQKYHPQPENVFQKKIAFAEAELVPYYNRQNNRKASYDMFIQFSIVAKNEHFCSEPKCRRYIRTPYKKPLFHAMKHFMNFVFEGRSSVIQVKCLELGNRPQIVRLPEGIKFNIQQLKGLAKFIENYSKGLEPVLDKNCHYSLHGDLADVEEVNPNFGEVTFGYINSEVDPFEHIPSWPCLKMNFLNKYRRFENDGFITFISSLREIDKEVGTTFTFGFKEGEDTIELLRFIAEQFSTEIKNRSLTLSMKNSKRLFITYRLGIEYMSYEACGPPCILKMEVKE